MRTILPIGEIFFWGGGGKGGPETSTSSPGCLGKFALRAGACGLWTPWLLTVLVSSPFVWFFFWTINTKTARCRAKYFQIFIHLNFEICSYYPHFSDGQRSPERLTDFSRNAPVSGGAGINPAKSTRTQCATRPFLVLDRGGLCPRPRRETGQGQRA